MIFEKRIGLVQLFALLILLFFVIVTRGSLSTPVLSLPRPARAFNPSLSLRAARTRGQNALDGQLDLPFQPTTAREPVFRERRSQPPERRNGASSSVAGVARSASQKRQQRMSSSGRRALIPPNMPSRIQSESNLVMPALGSPLSPLALQVPPLSAHPGPASAPSPLSGEASESSSQHTSPNASVSTLRHFSNQPKSRVSPVSSIRRKFRQFHAPRAASLDETSIVAAPVEPSSKKRRFSLSLGTKRRGTVNSFDDDGTPAWLSTSGESGGEESEDDKNISDQSSTSQRLYLPTPEPSDLDQSSSNET